MKLDLAISERRNMRVVLRAVGNTLPNMRGANRLEKIANKFDPMSTYVALTPAQARFAVAVVRGFLAHLEGAASPFATPTMLEFVQNVQYVADKIAQALPARRGASRGNT